MLYDPKWEVQADPMSLASLIAWLEKQPAAGKYKFTDPRNCMLCQYFSAMGYEKVRVNPIEWRHGTPEITQSLPYEFNSIAHARTFGGALKRARGFHAAQTKGL